MTLRIAFTGTGFSKYHARAAQAAHDVALTAVVNHRPESMAEFAAEFGVPRQHSNVEALLAEGGIDGLVISTPNYLHVSEALAALRAGVHVMVEKPMAVNAAEAAAMQEASQESGALLMVAHCWRFDSEVLWLREQVAAGRLGDIVRTKSYGVHVNWGPKGWFTQRQFAGAGAMADMGVHALDTTRFLLGDPQPKTVFASVGTYYRDVDVDDTCVALVTWENGVTSYFEVGWWQPHAEKAEVAVHLYGRCGFGELFPTRLALPTGEDGAVQEVASGFPAVRYPYLAPSMYERQFAHFADCIRSGRTPSPGGAEGLVNMRIVDAAYESARTGEAIHL
jgi:predicted dehydrogenase